MLVEVDEVDDDEVVLFQIRNEFVDQRNQAKYVVSEVVLVLLVVDVLNIPI